MTTRADGKSHYQANRVAELARKKAARLADPAPFRARDNAYRKANPQKRKAADRSRWSRRRRAARGPDKEAAISAYKKEYRAANLALLLARVNARHVARQATDKVYKLVRSVRRRIQKALRRAASSKSSRTLELIGCSGQELVAHLEGKFLPGMSWENRSAWHVDHQRPCSSFDLTDPEQQRACFHFSNLQPLWAADNLRKSRSWEPLKYFAAAADDISRPADGVGGESRI